MANKKSHPIKKHAETNEQKTAILPVYTQKGISRSRTSLWLWLTLAACVVVSIYLVWHHYAKEVNPQQNKDHAAKSSNFGAKGYPNTAFH